MQQISSKARNLWKKYVTDYEQTKRVQPWFAANGDKTLRLNYDLNETSVVLDLGGYEGQWASDIFSMYRSEIHVFEPVASFAASIRHRFQRNTKIQVHEFGLGAKDEQTRLQLAGDSSSMHRGNPENEVAIRIVKASDFLAQNKISQVDLLKINIEGAEYDLLDHLLETGWTQRIKNLQIQFHAFVPNAEPRMKRIQEKLGASHRLTYQFPFVWENWELRESGSGDH